MATARLRVDRIIREVHHEFLGTFGIGQTRSDSDKEGKFYEWPKSYPAILFDDSGYAVFSSEADCSTTLRRKGVEWRNTARKMNIPGGIRSLERYTRCDHSHLEQVFGTGVWTE